MPKSILIVVTSHGAIDDSHRTGLWFEEFAVPYTLFAGEGYAVTVASPRGGDAPIDPASMESYETSADNESARSALCDTLRLDTTLHAADFDAIFFPGGHGTMFDLPDDLEVQRLVNECVQDKIILAAVCHGPAAFVNARLSDGAPLVQGRRLTAFTDEEEREVQLDKKMPFLLETTLRELGAEFYPAQNWAENVVVDDRLVTGQNPQSSGAAAQAVIRLLSGEKG